MNAPGGASGPQQQGTRLNPPDEGKKTHRTAQDDRNARLAERLRANLQRRKAQARSRREGAAASRPEGLSEGREEEKDAEGAKGGKG